MINRKSFRIILIVYLIFFSISGAVSLQYGVESKKVINTNLNERHYQRETTQDETSTILFLLSPLIWLFGMAVIILQILSWISLFMFWRLGPALFTITIMLGYIVLPLIGALYHYQISPITQFTLSGINTDISNFYIPLNYIHVLLAGSIMTMIYLKDGRRLFEHKIRISKDKI